MSIDDDVLLCEKEGCSNLAVEWTVVMEDEEEGGLTSSHVYYCEEHKPDNVEEDDY